MSHYCGVELTNIPITATVVYVEMKLLSNYCLTTVVLNLQVYQLLLKKLLLNYCSVEMKLLSNYCTT